METAPPTTKHSPRWTNDALNERPTARCQPQSLMSLIAKQVKSKFQRSRQNNANSAGQSCEKNTRPLLRAISPQTDLAATKTQKALDLPEQVLLSTKCRSLLAQSQPGRFERVGVQTLPRPLVRAIAADSFFAPSAGAALKVCLVNLRKTELAELRLKFYEHDLIEFVSHWQASRRLSEFSFGSLRFQMPTHARAKVLEGASSLWLSSINCQRLKIERVALFSTFQLIAAWSVLARQDGKTAIQVLQEYVSKALKRDVSLEEETTLARQRVLDFVILEAELSLAASKKDASPDLIGALLAEQRVNADLLQEASSYLAEVEQKNDVDPLQRSPLLRRAAIGRRILGETL